MKKLMFVAVAALSTAAFATEMPETKKIAADAEGYYDVTLTTKHLAHAEKTVSKSFKTSKKATAVEQFLDYCEDNNVTNLAGFTVLELTGVSTIDVPAEELKVDKITFKYSYFEQDKYGSYKTKVVSKSSKGLYYAKTGNVYLWDTDDKVQQTKDDEFSLVDSAKAQKGYRAYMVPLEMHKQFVRTDDGKAAGGFTGSVATAADGTPLDFAGLTAFGTGTLDKDDVLKTVAGNVAGKYPDDIKYGCYGTWKLNADTKSAKYGSVKEALLAKKCVELVDETK